MGVRGPKSNIEEQRFVAAHAEMTAKRWLEKQKKKKQFEGV